VKLDDKRIPVKRGGDLLESTFGIAKGDEANILTILRDKLYSDKIMAVIREYTTNAVDAHVEAGKSDLPIKVMLPTRLKPTFSVRDFGLGLDEDDVRNIYVMYGASTKRQSNDVTGQLGLGCKCGFAYTDQFQITSFFGGEKKIYNAYIDESNLGKIALMGTSPSTEVDGIEITIAVDPDDVRSFQEKAAFLFSHFKTTPDISGLTDYKLQEFDYWLDGELENGVRWGLQSKNSSPTAVMGNIPYIIDPRQFSFGERGTYVMNHGIHIWFNIGDLQMAANREALEYTPKTKKHIRVVVKEVVNKVAQQASTKVQDAKTYREACSIFNLMKRESIFKVFAGKSGTDWNGEKVDGEILKTETPGQRWDLNLNQNVDIEPDTKLQKVYLQRSYRSNSREYTMQQTWVTGVAVTDDVTICELDVTTKWRVKLEYQLDIKRQAILASTQRYSHYGSDGFIYLVAFKDDAERQAMYKKWHLDEWDIQKVSDLPDPPNTFVASATPTMSKTQKKKHTAKFFTLKDNFDTAPTRKSDNWDKENVDINDESEDRIYIILDHFFPHMWKLRRSYFDLEFVVQCAQKLGVDTKRIYGVKEGYVEKISENASWKKLSDLVFEACQKAKPDIITAISKDESIRQAPSSLRPYTKKKDRFPAGSPMRELLKFYDSLVADSNATGADEDIIKLMRMFGEDVRRKAAKELDRLLDAVRERYPLLTAFRIFPDGYHHTLYSEQLDAVVQYVEIIEKQFSEDDNDDF